MFLDRHGKPNSVRMRSIRDDIYLGRQLPSGSSGAPKPGSESLARHGLAQG